MLNSADGKLMLWDVRSAKGCLRTFDQHNGDTSAGPKSGCCLIYLLNGVGAL